MVPKSKPPRRSESTDLGAVPEMAARNHPVARATSEKSMRNTTNRQVAKLPPEEPDAGKLHVRVCEGASGQPLALLGVRAYVQNRIDGDKAAVGDRGRF